MDLFDVASKLAALAGTGLPEPLPASPMPTLAQWLADAIAGTPIRVPNPDAMTLATVDAAGRPSARVVLCKALDPALGTLTFYTNHHSPKARAIADAGGRVAGVFHWDAAGRQARVEGLATPAPDAVSDAYFASRPLLSRLGAWASQQSQPMSQRADLYRAVAREMQRWGVTAADLLTGRGHVDRPPHWGGFVVTLHHVELWVGGSGRLHDRAAWTRSADGSAPWVGTRLFP